MFLKRIFCVTTYVKNNDNKFILLFHRKLKKWVPPGGKVDPHETPEEAAIRECYEETGLRIELIGDKPPIESTMMSPLGLQLNTIIPGEKDHIDFIYQGRPTGNNELHISEREAEKIGWFSYEEVLLLDTFPSVISWCNTILSGSWSKCVTQ